MGSSPAVAAPAGTAPAAAAAGGRRYMFGREGGFPGFLGRGPRAGRGDVRAAILALLAEEPMHGYQIMRELGERSGGVWRPSPGSIYPTLQQLEDEELVRPETGDGGRRVFTLTDAGREAQSAAAGGPAPWEEVGAEGDASALELRDLVGQVMGAARQVAARRRARADRAGQGRAARRAPQALPHPRGGLPGALRDRTGGARGQVIRRCRIPAPRTRGQARTMRA